LAWLSAASGVLLATVALTASGCDDPVARLCDLACECTGCTDDQASSCEKSSQGTYESSEEKGCTAEADAYLACYEEKFECKSGQVDVDACEDIKTTWYDCLSGTTTEKTVCDEADEKLVDECGVEGDETEVGECSGIEECTANCVLEATCEEINGEAEGNLGACLQACQTQGAGGSSS
jgi:hypothetical protein